MSRARNIKPGFFKNDRLADCEPLARILFVGLWCEADREGRLEDRPKRLKAEYLCYDECDIDSLLDQLTNGEFIVRYSVDGRKYIQILAFKKHQNPHVKEGASTIPAPDEHGASTVLAGLIPDSPFLIPDSIPTPTVPASGDDHVVAVVLAAYHEALPNCEHVNVRTPKRCKRIQVADKLAKSICAQQGWPYERAEFWSAYFAECATDPWMRGDIPNPKNPRWRQNLDVLIAEDRFAGVMDRAISNMQRSNA